MTAKSVFALIIAASIVAIAGFQAGARLSRSSASQPHPPTSVAAQTTTHPSTQNEKVEQRDFARVTIENVDQLAFEQAYDLLRSASRPALELWAKRLEDLPSSPHKSAAVATFYKTLVQVDAAAAVDLVLRTTRRDTRTEAAAAVQATVAPANLPEIGRMLSELKVYAGGFYNLITEWSQYDPESASRFAASHLEEVDSGAIAALVSNWAQFDAPAAKAWLDQLDGAKKDALVYENFYEGWMISDRSGAVRDLIARGAEKELRGVISSAASRLYRASEAEAYAFFGSLPDRAAQRAAVRGLASGFFERTGEDPERGVAAADFADWLLDLPADIAGEQIGHVVAAWSSADPAGVQAWLQPMRVETRDRVLAQVCRAYPYGEAQHSFEAGFSIHDERAREEGLRAALQKAGSPERARQLIERLELPAAQIALLERFASEL